ncbi:MAG: ankyrin-like [Chthonomonadales bacterium]|nr:ankyrin-like [Chthonomonadales bacterium]
MKPVHKKLVRFSIPFLLCLPLAIMGGMSYRAERQQIANRALLIAIEKNDTAAVIALLAKGADANAQDWPPFAQWVWMNLRNRDGALVNAKDEGGDTPLYSARNVDCMKLLLDRGAQVNHRDRYGQTPLDYAVRDENINMMKLLLDHGALVNAKNSSGHTPLLDAVLYAKADYVKILLARGAQVNIKDNEGHTPLKRAQARQDPVILKLLTQAGAKE